MKVFFGGCKLEVFIDSFFIYSSFNNIQYLDVGDFSPISQEIFSPKLGGSHGEQI